MDLLGDSAPSRIQDPMTSSFIDESTIGGGADDSLPDRPAEDPMMASFIDESTSGQSETASHPSVDPMSQSFIDESTIGQDLLKTRMGTSLASEDVSTLKSLRCSRVHLFESTKVWQNFTTVTTQPGSF